MGANVIEKVSHLVDRILQTGWAVNLDLPDERFDTTKEAFDLVVAPGGANRNALMTNADQLQEGLEHRAFEDELVVSADGLGFAVLADGQAQVADQRPAALVDHCRQSGADARAVIDDAQNGAWCAQWSRTKVRSMPQTLLTLTGAGRLLRRSREMLSGASCEALTLLPVEALGQLGQSEEHWSHEQKRDQHEKPNEHGQKVPAYERRRSGSINMLRG